MNIYEKLSKLQARISVPKSKFNTFGNYKYRSLEDIFESLKKPIEELKLSIILADSVAIVGDRFYIKSSATLVNNEKPEETITASAFARETDIKKGMDSAQITGAASSYARKYALSGLLLLDDNQDADAQQPEQPQPQKPAPKKPNKPKEEPKPAQFDNKAFVKTINNIIRRRKLPDGVIETILKIHGLESLEEVATRDEAEMLYKVFKTITKEQLKKETEKEAKDDKK